MDKDLREFWSLEEAGRRLFGVGRSRAWELARAGDIPAIRLGRRWLVPRRAIEALMRRAVEEADERRHEGRDEQRVRLPAMDRTGHP